MSLPGWRSPAVFLDRDGTVIREVDYLADPDLVELLPGAAEGLRRLKAAGYRLCLTTNQSGVARGLLDEPTLLRIHERLHALLAEEGVALDFVGWSPYHPEHGEPPYRRDSACRKPRAGLYRRAATLLPLDLTRSWAVGDAIRDLEAGAEVGARGVLVRTGKGAQQEAQLATRLPGAACVDDLQQAAARIIETARGAGTG